MAKVFARVCYSNWLGVGFALTAVFLLLNGYRLRVSEDIGFQSGVGTNTVCEIDVQALLDRVD